MGHIWTPKVELDPVRRGLAQFAPEGEDPLEGLIARSTLIETPTNEEVRIVNDPILSRSGVLVEHSARVQDEYSSDEYVVRMVLVSGREARDDKLLHVEGLDFRGWDANPVWLWCHQWEQPPIGGGKWRGVYRRSGIHELWIDIRFPSRDLYPFGAMIGAMHAHGLIRTSSIGWVGTQVRILRDKDKRPIGVEHLRGEMLEGSSCSVPMDAHSLQQGIEVLGRSFHADDLETLRSQFARFARSPVDGTARAYELTPKEVLKVPKRADKQEVTRAAVRDDEVELVEEKYLDNPFDGRSTPGGLPKPEAGKVVDATERSADEAEGHDQVELETRAAAAEARVAELEAELEKRAAAEEPSPSNEAAEDEAAAEAAGGREEPPAAENDTESRSAESESDESSGEGSSSSDPASNAQADFRGPVGKAFDAAYDAYVGEVMNLERIGSDLWSMGHGLFASGRSIDEAEIREALVAGFRAHVEAVAKRGGMLVEDPGAEDGLAMAIDRSISRAEASHERMGEALAGLRDAFLLAEEAEVEEALEELEEAALEGRAGAKLSKSTRTKVQRAIDGIGQGSKGIRRSVKILADLLEDRMGRSVEDVEERSAEEDQVDDAGGHKEPELERDPELEALERRAAALLEADPPEDPDGGDDDDGLPADPPLAEERQAAATRTVDPIDELATRLEAATSRAARTDPDEARPKEKTSRRSETFPGVRVPKSRLGGVGIT